MPSDLSDLASALAERYSPFVDSLPNDSSLVGWINAIVGAIRAVKADQESPRLQNEFYERSKHPLDTSR